MSRQVQEPTNELDLDDELEGLTRSIDALRAATDGIAAAIDAEIFMSGSAVGAMLDILIGEVRNRSNAISQAIRK